MLDPAEALASTVTNLRNERDGLRRAMRTRAIIEQAKGVLVERLGLSPDEAFDHLVELSQKTNIKLVELAASLVGHRAPTPEVSKTYRAEVVETVKPVSDDVIARTPELEALQSHHLLVSERIASATTFDELAGSMVFDSPGWPAPHTVTVLLVEADGALRLVGATGLALEERSQWARVPPLAGLSVVTVAHTHTPVVLTDTEAIRRDFPSTSNLPHPVGALVTVPLVSDDVLLGVLRLDWEHGLGITPEAERYLIALGVPCARRLAALLVGPTSREPELLTQVEDIDVLSLALEALHIPAVMLSAVHDHENVVDFRIEHANSVALAFAVEKGMRLAGGSLLTLFPHAGSRHLLPALVEVAATGVACHLSNVSLDVDLASVPGSSTWEMRAVRLWERLLVTWQVVTPAREVTVRHREVGELLERTIPAVTVEGVDVSGRQAGEGSWCDVVRVSDDTVLLVVGDVTGAHPLLASERLRAVLRGYALAGLDVTEVLAAANTYVVNSESERSVNITVARFVPGAGELTWATAGQGVLLYVGDDEESRILPGPLGLPLGVAAGTVYTPGEAALVKGDRVLMATEALLTAESRVLTEGVRWLRDVARTSGDPESVESGALLILQTS